MLQLVGAAKIGMNGEAAFNLTALFLSVLTFSNPHVQTDLKLIFISS
jgi:hypothetical protein